MPVDIGACLLRSRGTTLVCSNQCQGIIVDVAPSGIARHPALGQSLSIREQKYRATDAQRF